MAEWNRPGKNALLLAEKNMISVSLVTSAFASHDPQARFRNERPIMIPAICARPQNLQGTSNSHQSNQITIQGNAGPMHAADGQQFNLVLWDINRLGLEKIEYQGLARRSATGVLPA
jgi:hypothetical protein